MSVDYFDYLQGSRVWLLVDDDWQPAVVSSNKGGLITFTTDNGKVSLYLKGLPS